MTRRTSDRSRKRSRTSQRRRSAPGSSGRRSTSASSSGQSQYREDNDDRDHRAFVAESSIRKDEDHRDPGERWDEQRGLLER